MKYLLLLVLLSCTIYITAQTLNLPERQESALNGSQFVELVTNYSLTDRENEIYNQVMSGNVPDFQRTLIPISFTETISTVSYTVTYYVLPDYLAIGCDTNYFLCPMSPLMAQLICNATGCTMPTRKMVNQIWNAATVKLAPSTISPSPEMITIPVMNTHNTTVCGQRNAVIASHPLGELVGGDKKDVVISNIIYGNPSPGRVVIYGWHQLNGNPIQPLYAGHEDTYADYSHGIRLVQNAITINGVSNTVTSVLQSSTLYSLLSDENIVSVPWYPSSEEPTMSTPQSFAVTRESSTSLRLHISNNPLALSYYVQLSNDGLNFSETITLPASNTIITDLESENLYFIRIAAVGTSSASGWSEVLGAVTSANSPNILIVNGFDRAISGNTYNFIRQHGNAIKNEGYCFDAATNEAVINELISLQNYQALDYILGNESTVNETFSSSEQNIIKLFLQNGGRLFVSGGEIAWDLDHMGSVDDRTFYNQFLKAEYIYDAPNNQSNTFYSFEPVIENIFNELTTITYDNGTNGTYNVSYPDVIGGINGGEETFFYSDLITDFAGVSFEGLFPEGTSEGKLVNLGVPFETVYPESSRNLMMSKILEFFFPFEPTSIPLVNSPVIYCQNDTALALTAIGENLLWYASAFGGTGSLSAIIPDTETPGTYTYYVSQTINNIESERAEIIVEIKPRPVPPVLTHIGTQLFSNFVGTNQWYDNGQEILESNNQSYQPVATGFYFVKASENECYSELSDTFFVEVPLFTAYTINLYSGAFPEPISDTCFESFYFSFEDEDTDFNNDFSNFFQNDYSINSNLFETGISLKNPYINEDFGEYALITDAAIPYLNNNLSSIRLKVRCVECNYGEFNLYFYHKLECDSLYDGGLVQYSIDDGISWNNIINCPFCDLTNFYTINDTITSMYDVGFNNSISTWELCGINFSTQENISEVDFRFIFSSDLSDTDKNGWLIDNISICSNPVLVSANNLTNGILIFPNPTNNMSVIHLKNPQDKIDCVNIYNITSQNVTNQNNIFKQEYLFYKNDLKPGLYLYEIKTINNYYYSGKFIVE